MGRTLTALLLLTAAILACAPMTVMGAGLEAAPRVGVSSTPTPTLSPTPTLEICQVRAAFLNLRAGPGTAYRPLAVLSQGARLTLLPTPAQGRWQAVKTDGREGWVNTYYLTCK